MKNFSTTDRDFEEALRFLSEKMPDAHELPKPTLLHSVRVGVYLYNHGYNLDICIAGLLHDLVEDSEVTIDTIENKFGKEIASIVHANTKNDALEEQEKYKELLQRCVDTSEGASIVKAADIIDNLVNYRRAKIEEGINNMLNFGKILLDIKPEGYTDKIFEKLRDLIRK